MGRSHQIIQKKVFEQSKYQNLNDIRIRKDYNIKDMDNLIIKREYSILLFSKISIFKLFNSILNKLFTASDY